MRLPAIFILTRSAACWAAAMLLFASEVQADGEIDAGFGPDVGGTVLATALQPDGCVLLGGTFTTVDGVTRNRLARVNSQGILDVAFDPDIGGTVNAILVQPDGKIVVGGSFTSVAGMTRNRIARLHPDGALDDAFDPGANGDVHCLAALPKLEGIGASASDLYNQAAGAAGLAGTPALPEEIPHADGIENLPKYAFNLDLADPGGSQLVPATGTSGLPHISLQPAGETWVLRFEYVRREGHGLHYVSRKSPTLGTWSDLVSAPFVTAIDGGWERVIINEPIDLSLSTSWFGKVDVTGDF